MLKKLLKYDLKDVYKLLVVFYVIAILCAILTRLFFSIDNSAIFNVLGYIASGTLISMFFNILINSLMRVWVRFKKNLYGAESYLTHTLPVSKKSIYLSKFLTSIITMFSSVLVMVLCAFIAYYSKENMVVVRDFLQIMASIYDSTMIGIILIIFFVFFLEMVFALQCGYTGMILGHRSNNGKMAKSVLYGFGSYMGFQVFTLLLLFIVSLFNSDVKMLFTTSEGVNMGIIKNIMFGAIIIYGIYLFICYIINMKLFENGVNVE